MKVTLNAYKYKPRHIFSSSGFLWEIISTLLVISKALLN